MGLRLSGARFVVLGVVAVAAAVACGEDADAVPAPGADGGTTSGGTSGTAGSSGGTSGTASSSGGGTSSSSSGGGTSSSSSSGSPNDAGVDAARPTEPPTVTREPVINNVGGTAWDMAFLPDGSALVTLRGGQIRKLTFANPVTSTVVANAGSAGNPLAGLFSEGQSGLMGIAVDPAFATNRRIYVYMSHDSNGTKDNRVVRYRLTEQDTLSERTDIVTGISYKAVATANGGAGSHSGGRLRFGPDGFLYQTTGDNHNATIPQNVEALGSKVLRFDTDGQPATGNPNIGSRNLIWAMGFRNPQGIAFHPLTGAVFIAEHGPGNDDEVTKLSAGTNGGWNPNNNGEYNGYSGAVMTDTNAVPTATAAIWKHPDSSGMSPCTFLRGASWKSWQNRLAVGFLAAQKIQVLDFNEGLTAVTATEAFPDADVNERVRSLVIGPDEKLYVVTDGALIYRFAAK